MDLTCEACEIAAVEIVEPCDDAEEPYRLCAACHTRLHARALRPAEWYSLAKRHGWYQFLLHDDFYDEDGTATQPEEPVLCPLEFLAPTLEAVAHDAEQLLDYSITRWRFEAATAASWTTLPHSQIVSALAKRFGRTRNEGIRSRVLEICASALRESGADLVRYAWGEYPETVALSALAEASAACLPFPEGFDKVTTALAADEGPRKRDSMLSLSYFHSPAVLDWIEHHAFDPITESWGNLAAASQLDWARAEHWMGCNRPLSLVALDGLAAIVRPQTPLLRDYAPCLIGPPSRGRFVKVLSEYAKRDCAPRVQHRTAFLLANVDVLTTH